MRFLTAAFLEWESEKRGGEKKIKKKKMKKQLLQPILPSVSPEICLGECLR